MATAATLPASEHWDATSPAEVKLQAALSNVFLSSPNSVITKAPDKKTNRFILATDGYHGKAIFLDSALHKMSPAT